MSASSEYVELADRLIDRAEFRTAEERQLDATMAVFYLLRALVQRETGR